LALEARRLKLGGWLLLARSFAMAHARQINAPNFHQILDITSSLLQTLAQDKQPQTTFGLGFLEHKNVCAKLAKLGKLAKLVPQTKRGF